MTVAYSDDLVLLCHDDMETMLPAIQDADLAIIDPPYGETNLEWDRRGQEWLALVSAALKPNGMLVLWGSMRSLLVAGPAVLAAGWSYSQDVVWEKHNGSNAKAEMFRRVHEHAVLFFRGAWEDTYHDPQFSMDASPRYVRRKQRPQHWGPLGEHVYRSEDGGPRLMRSVMYERSAHGHAIHPTQKPLGVLRTLIQYGCPPGGLVLDPFAGSASTLVAARWAGRRAIGIEKHEPYVQAATARLSQGVLDLSPGIRMFEEDWDDDIVFMGIEGTGE